MIPKTPSTPSLGTALHNYLASVREARSEHTYHAYQRAAKVFLQALTQAQLADESTSLALAKVEWFKVFLRYLQAKTGAQHHYSSATESLYVTAMLGFVDDKLATTLPSTLIEEIRHHLKKKRRKVPLRQPPFQKELIEQIIEAVQQAAQGPFKDEEQRLNTLRDRALIVTLADSGLRVFELCGLSRGQLDMREGKAMVIGKGNKESAVRFSPRALRAIRIYLEARAKTDGAQKKELSALPLLARHDWAARKKTLAMTTRSAERIIDRWVAQVLGEDQVGTITPHTFRHYFVTVVIRASGGDFQVAKELARHSTISTTQRYAHINAEELDRAYEEIFKQRPER